ncbi:MAG: hypothetical protein V3V75_08505, partial [Thermoguttaceae bacterium]
MIAPIRQPETAKMSPTVRRADFGAGEPAGILEFVIADSDLVAGGVGGEADHERRGERPRLRGVVAHLAHVDAGLFLDLAAHRLFQALARLDES